MQVADSLKQPYSYSIQMKGSQAYKLDWDSMPTWQKDPSPVYSKETFIKPVPLKELSPQLGTWEKHCKTMKDEKQKNENGNVWNP